VAKAIDVGRHVAAPLCCKLYKLFYRECTSNLCIDTSIWIPANTIYTINVLDCGKSAHVRSIQPLVGPSGQHLRSTACHTGQPTCPCLLEHVGRTRYELQQSSGSSSIHGYWRWSGGCSSARYRGRDLLRPSTWTCNGESSATRTLGSTDDNTHSKQAIYTVFLSTGSLVGGVAGGYIVAAMGLTWLHWINVILSAIVFALCLCFQAETLFDRPKSPSNTPHDTNKPNIEKREITTTTSQSLPTSYPRYTYLRSLRLVTYKPGLGQNLLAPYKVMRFPGVWLVSAWYAGLVGLIVTVSTVGTQVVAAPPYLWGKNVGLINIGGILGSLIGCIYTYLVSDWTTKRLATRDTQGFTEPESRLVTALPALFVATFGSLVFGFVAQAPSQLGWVGLQFGLGMIAFGLMQAPSVGFNYLIESYGSVAGDCFVAVTSVRAIISFAWTFFIGEWVHHDGPAQPFGIFGMLMGLFGLLTVPMLIWGKRLRIWTAKWVPEGSAM
jgi:MFS family permease